MWLLKDGSFLLSTTGGWKYCTISATDSAQKWLPVATAQKTADTALT